MQAVGPAAAGHHTAGELVHDDDFAIFHDVLNIATVERVRLDGGLDVVFEVPVFGVGDVADAQQAFDFFPAFVGDRDVPVLFIYYEVAREFLGLTWGNVNFLALFQLGDNAVDFEIFVGGLFAGAGDDEWGAGFVNQDEKL
jgi:hypothetical protein